MQSRKRERKKSLTAEEKYQRAISARRKFRAIVKLIIANLQWLQDIEDDQLGDNVKKNIALLTRKKGKKSMLTLKEKAMLNKPQELRTEEEKTHLKRIIGNLKCFRRYPPEVKNELPAVMYFVFFGPNRVIVKQDYEPLNMYVILSGEVIVSQTYWDALLKEYVTKDVLVMGAGNYFGEVSLLHGIKRTATCTTSNACEFLYIKSEDFDRVLKASVADLWKEVQMNMSQFSYFKDWNETDLRESCIYAKKKNFQIDQIILSYTMTNADSVFFVMKGFCYLVEFMMIKTTFVKGIPHYSLVKDGADKVENLIKQQNTIKDLKKMFKQEEEETSIDQPILRHSIRPSIQTDTASFFLTHMFKPEPPEPPSTTRMHFIKICTFSRLACFNVGETLKNRVIVAGTNTECLLLPRYFLYDKGMSTFKNIQQFLTNHIPGTENIFKNFLQEKKWSTYKQKLVGEILRKERAGNFNTIHNVPYTIRLAEDLGEI